MYSDGQEIDVYAPFIAKDSLEYEDLAAFILGRPITCWRNQQIQSLRTRGRSEAAIREWVKGYDGEGPTPSSKISAWDRADGLAYAFEPCDDFIPL